MAYTATRGQLAGDVRETLERWLPSRLAPSGHSNFEISEFSAPDAGYSGKTVFFTASWNERDGETHREDLVLRTQASDHQLFVEPDAVRQAEVMRMLGRHNDVKTPEIVLTERDPNILGAPFYLMNRVNGRTPSDVPSWHKRGWAVDLTPPERELMCDNALRSLVAVHRISDPDDLTFLRGDLDDADESTALQRYVTHLHAWYEGCRPDLVVGTDALARAISELVDFAPKTNAEGVVWGDARVGNMSFADDHSVAALFDWETATTGPPDIDLGWWLMFERYLCESLGFSRLPGVPDDAETVRRYEELGGQLTGDISYYTLLAAFVLALITNRLASLLTRDGLDAEIARTYPATAVALVEQYLDEHQRQRKTAP
jgi:aminoglycoside phosphotransferase (APT) family kinase protein